MSDAVLHVAEIAPAGGGDAPIVVCVHGSMDRGRSFARLASRLTDCRVVTYDRRGYAGSRGVLPAATSLQQHADDLISVAGGRRVLAFGHSYGGDVVLLAAKLRPDLFRSVVAYEPPLPWFDWWHQDQPRSRYRDGLSAPDPGDAAESFVSRMVGPERYAKSPRWFREELRKDGPAFVAELRALADDPPPYDPSEITSRVLVVRGSETYPRQVRGTDYLAASLPDAELAVIAGAGHGGHGSHPDDVARLLRSELIRSPLPR